jgi:hypothetical protein
MLGQRFELLELVRQGIHRQTSRGVQPAPPLYLPYRYALKTCRLDAPQGLLWCPTNGIQGGRTLLLSASLLLPLSLYKLLPLSSSTFPLVQKLALVPCVRPRRSLITHTHTNRNTLFNDFATVALSLSTSTSFPSFHLPYL